ncbi:hypothetical protein HYS47_02335 [Candidatus Woesearchaeota archaeon]|nr:hypothetical protein [Candidatus Woesearchaeota archaeon]
MALNHLKNVLARRDQIINNKSFRRGMVLFFFVVLLLVLLISFRFLFAVLALLFLSILIGFFLRPIRSLTLGIEIGILATVLSSMTHGIKAGLVVGLGVLTAKLIAEGSLSVYSLVIYPSHIIIAIGAGLIPEANITAVGIAAAVFHNLFTGLLSFVFLGGQTGKILTFVSTNLLFNAFLFWWAAPFLLRVMS